MNLERFAEILPPFLCPEHRQACAYSHPGEWRCPRCNYELTVAEGFPDLVDGIGERGGDERAERITFAYRFYSLVYPVVAFLAMKWVWKGDLGPLVRFYGERVQEAADAGEPFLDIATGDGSLTRIVLGKVKGTPGFICLDLSREMLAKASRRLRAWPAKLLYVQDILKANFSAGAFRHILCFGGIHVFPDPLAAMSQMHRLLAPDGALSGSFLLEPGTRWSNAAARWAIDKGLLTSAMAQDQIDAIFAAAGFEYARKLHNGRMLLFSLRKR